jgi:hypothetical protein
MSQSKPTDAARAIEHNPDDEYALVDQLRNKQGTEVLVIHGSNTTHHVWPRPRHGFLSRAEVTTRSNGRDFAPTLTMTPADVRRNILNADDGAELVDATDVDKARPAPAMRGDDCDC